MLENAADRNIGLNESPSEKEGKCHAHFAPAQAPG